MEVQFPGSSFPIGVKTATTLPATQWFDWAEERISAKAILIVIVR